jgi:hypothetical protein
LSNCKARLRPFLCPNILIHGLISFVCRRLWCPLSQQICGNGLWMHSRYIDIQFTPYYRRPPLSFSQTPALFLHFDQLILLPPRLTKPLSLVLPSTNLAPTGLSQPSTQLQVLLLSPPVLLQGLPDGTISTRPSLPSPGFAASPYALTVGAIRQFRVSLEWRRWLEERWSVLDQLSLPRQRHPPTAGGGGSGACVVLNTPCLQLPFQHVLPTVSSTVGHRNPHYVDSIRF